MQNPLVHGYTDRTMLVTLPAPTDIIHRGPTANRIQRRLWSGEQANQG